MGTWRRGRETAIAICVYQRLRFYKPLSDLFPLEKNPVRWVSRNSNLLFRDLKTAAAAAKLLQSFPTLCDPIDSSPPGSSVPGILQARILEWVAISFSL